MAGKTDVELVEPTRAAALVADEQEIVATGKGFSNHEEVLTDAFGDETWFSTSKVPLHNAEGQIIGLAGVTHDITALKRLESDLTQNRNQLDYVLSGVSDGIAMFDSQGTLVYSNAQYRSHFPLTSEVRRSGQHIRDILEAVVKTGEQVIEPGREETWIDEIASSLKQVSEEEVLLFDGRWLLVRTRPTADGSALVVVSDLTKIKKAEAALRSMTEQLKLLATTDGLTELTNRRAFDAALENELARCRRSGEPISVLLADVDRFKAYNDIYGHQAGDEVLKSVAQCLKSTVGDQRMSLRAMAARSSSRSCPGPDEDGAFFIADAFRESLFAMGIPHKGGDKGIVTVSVGIATFTERECRPRCERNWSGGRTRRFTMPRTRGAIASRAGVPGTMCCRWAGCGPKALSSYSGGLVLVLAASLGFVAIGLHYPVEHLGRSADEADIGVAVVAQVVGFAEQALVVLLESVGHAAGILGIVAEGDEGLLAERDGGAEGLAFEGFDAHRHELVRVAAIDGASGDLDFGEVAADHFGNGEDAVAAGHRNDDHFGFRGAGGAQDIEPAAVAVEHLYTEALDQLDLSRVVVDEGHRVALGAQQARDDLAEAAIAEDDDVAIARHVRAAHPATARGH